MLQKMYSSMQLFVGLWTGMNLGWSPCRRHISFIGFSPEFNSGSGIQKCTAWFTQAQQTFAALNYQRNMCIHSSVFMKMWTEEQLKMSATPLQKPSTVEPVLRMFTPIKFTESWVEENTIIIKFVSGQQNFQ